MPDAGIHDSPDRVSLSRRESSSEIDSVTLNHPDLSEEFQLP
jgi:hypothetical protein